MDFAARRYDHSPFLLENIRKQSTCHLSQDRNPQTVMTSPSNAKDSEAAELCSWFRSYMEAYRKSLLQTDVTAELTSFRDVILETKVR